MKCYIIFKARRDYEIDLSWKLVEGYFNHDKALAERDSLNAMLTMKEHTVGWHFDVTEVDILDAANTSENGSGTMSKLSSSKE